MQCFLIVQRLGEARLFATFSEGDVASWTARRALGWEFGTRQNAEEEMQARLDRGWHLRGAHLCVIEATTQTYYDRVQRPAVTPLNAPGLTIHDLAVYRGIQPNEPGGEVFNGGEYMRVGVPFMGGCAGCQATLAAYNSYPSKAGYLMCHDCIGDSGFETVEEANEDIFKGNMPGPTEDEAVERVKEMLDATEVDD